MIKAIDLILVNIGIAKTLIAHKENAKLILHGTSSILELRSGSLKVNCG